MTVKLSKKTNKKNHFLSLTSMENVMRGISHKNNSVCSYMYKIAVLRLGAYSVSKM